jgi:putative transcription factor
MQCEMCGSDDELYRASVEGTIINLCKKCARFGKVLERVKVEPPRVKRESQRKSAPAQTKETETIFVISSGYAERIKDRRESLGLKQEDLAKKINEKDTLLHKIETGAMEPSIKLARKLEKFLQLKLVEEHTEEIKGSSNIKSEGVTIGDMARLKKR